MAGVCFPGSQAKVQALLFQHIRHAEAKGRARRANEARQQILHHEQVGVY